MGYMAMWWLMVAVMVVGAMSVDLPPPQLLKVGDQSGWKPDFNYTQWAAGKKFYVGYWLIFKFDKHYYNVLEVNKTNYDNCNDQGFITNITKGGRDVFNLTQARPYYFLSSHGFCYRGMKLAINVTNYVATAPAPDPAPSPAKNAGISSIMKRQLLLSIVLQVTLVWAFLLKLN